VPRGGPGPRRDARRQRGCGRVRARAPSRLGLFLSPHLGRADRDRERGQLLLPAPDGDGERAAAALERDREARDRSVERRRAGGQAGERCVAGGVVAEEREHGAARGCGGGEAGVVVDA
jgi:hypothetical protein